MAMNRSILGARESCPFGLGRDSRDLVGSHGRVVMVGIGGPKGRLEYRNIDNYGLRVVKNQHRCAGICMAAAVPGGGRLGRKHAGVVGKKPDPEDGHRFTMEKVVHMLRLVVAQGWERHQDGTRRGDGAVAVEEEGSVIVKEDVEDSVLPDITPFLRSVGIMELSHLRKMSCMCSLTYFMERKVRQESLKRLGLTLVTSSHACDEKLKEDMDISESVMDVFHHGDGMGIDWREFDRNEVDDEEDEIRGTLENETLGGEATWAEQGLTMMNMAMHHMVAKEGGKYVVYQSPEDRKNGTARRSSHDRLKAAKDLNKTKRILEYSEGDIHHRAIPASGKANNISYFDGLKRDQVEGREKDSDKSGQFVTGSKSSSLSCPTHWYVADDDEHRIRYFVIQGSDNMHHWKLNLTFDPVQFESASLGVKAHRGVYNAACQLYDVFLPLIMEHIEAHPSSTIAFTGHSLGGSLGTMLMMMYLHRGVLEPHNLAPVHTFGSPAVFCGGESCTGSCCGLDEKHIGVLDRLGLPHDAVRNVIMHKDIVPRAFACDYALVADFLKSVHENFRKHHCLSGDRRVMFNTIGQTLIVQPDEDTSFVNGEGYHPLLPKGPKIFALKHAKSQENLCNGPALETDGESNAQNPSYSRKVHSSEEAYWELMNMPHPLEILGNPGAYGDSGSISRYHNPDNYTRALRGVLKSRSKNAQTVLERAGQEQITYKPRIDKNRRDDVFRPSPVSGKSTIPQLRRQ
mmetsp:Transcript_5936/g.11587  ORF Transcript_5936/g.11587 Transcript_5936/m.11587 type:complete len:741 (-) Transcript_5936:123-2345(-)